MLWDEVSASAQKTLQQEVREELITHIIPFWNRMRDPRGGFFGRMDPMLKLEENADKGAILHARILWFYSSAYLALKDESLLEYAAHAYRFLRDCCYDRENGGMFWSVTCDGAPNDSMKHTYNQAFAIYGLCAYYDACGDNEALTLANELFETIESRTRDTYGYMEAFSRSWTLIGNEHLSEHGLPAEKTMNTTLHLIEAYTQLYRITKSEAVGVRLQWLLEVTADKIYDAERGALKVFFDKQWNELGDVYSYGHDIEATWLMDLACDVLGNAALSARYREINNTIAEKIQQIAFDGTALLNESAEGKLDGTRIWWVQAEGVVGFLNAFCRTGNLGFHHTACALWSYIKTHQIDRRDGGEWHAELTQQGEPLFSFDMAGPWKCPYHNGRMCLEVMKTDPVCV